MLIRLQHETMQQMATNSATVPPQEESDYMPLNHKTKMPANDGEDALYDFCFMPGNSAENISNALLVKTLPVQSDKKNNSIVRFKTHSPLRKQLEKTMFECVIEEWMIVMFQYYRISPMTIHE